MMMHTYTYLYVYILIGRSLLSMIDDRLLIIDACCMWQETQNFSRYDTRCGSIDGIVTIMCVLVVVVIFVHVLLFFCRATGTFRDYHNGGHIQHSRTSLGNIDSFHLTLLN